MSAGGDRKESYPAARDSFRHSSSGKKSQPMAQIMHIRLGAIMGCACLALAGCAEYPRAKPKRMLAHEVPPVAEQKKPMPVTTQSIAPPTPPILADPTAADPPAPDPTLAVIAVEEQLKAAWKQICALRNVEYVEKGRVNETEAQKHFIDEKCADARRDSHMLPKSSSGLVEMP
jgi:hypothetical protein